jgi:hypothetical protein
MSTDEAHVTLHLVCSWEQDDSQFRFIQNAAEIRCKDWEDAIGQAQYLVMRETRLAIQGAGPCGQPRVVPMALHFQIEIRHVEGK